MNEIPTITINMDDTCMRCFKPGACENGLCMSCSIKPLRNKIQKAIDEHYMNIKLIDKAKTEISGLVRCENCGGCGVISYNPNLNPNSFEGTATAKCTRCKGTGIE